MDVGWISQMGPAPRQKPAVPAAGTRMPQQTAGFTLQTTHPTTGREETSLLHPQEHPSRDGRGCRAERCHHPGATPAQGWQGTSLLPQQQQQGDTTHPAKPPPALTLLLRLLRPSLSPARAVEHLLQGQGMVLAGAGWVEMCPVAPSLSPGHRDASPAPARGRLSQAQQHFPKLNNKQGAFQISLTLQFLISPHSKHKEKKNQNKTRKQLT